jgi:hypothetical protein
MALKKLIGLMACVAVLGLASLAAAGIPDPDNSYATVGTAPDQISCVVCPAGDGGAMTQCYLSGGTGVDGTITFTVLDINLDPVVLYPAVDMWVEANGLCYCSPTATIADGPTDGSGQTTFSGPFYVGGCSDDNSTNIRVNGTLLNHPGLPIWFNSPDMNCDFVVNLSDVVIFAPAYYGAYSYCADFYWDGNINLSDVVILAQHIAHVCP